MRTGIVSKQDEYIVPLLVPDRGFSDSSPDRTTVE